MVQYEVGLFEICPGGGGVRIVGRSIEPDLVAVVRDRIAADRRRELAAIELPVRLVPRQDGSPREDV